MAAGSGVVQEQLEVTVGGTKFVATYRPFKVFYA